MSFDQSSYPDWMWDGTENTMQSTSVQPELGNTIISGHRLVAYTHQHDGGDGFLPHGVGILVDLRPSSFTPYVVWTIIRLEAKWVAENGNYCQTIQEAVDRYERRGGMG